MMMLMALSLAVLVVGMVVVVYTNIHNMPELCSYTHTHTHKELVLQQFIFMQALACCRYKRLKAATVDNPAADLQDMWVYSISIVSKDIVCSNTQIIALFSRHGLPGADEFELTSKLHDSVPTAVENVYEENAFVKDSVSHRTRTTPVQLC